MSHFAPDDFVAYYREEPLEFEGWNVASRWWNANQDQVVQAINENDWVLVKPEQFLVDVVEASNVRYAIYSDSSQVWVDAYEEQSCGHWMRVNEDNLFEFRDIDAAREGIHG